MVGLTNITTALGITLLILLFSVVLFIFNTRSVETSLITGFWKADADFCQESAVQLFLIYFGEAEYFSNSRAGYILVCNSSGDIINNPIRMHFAGGSSLNPSLSKSREYHITIDWLDEEGYEDFFPSKQLLTYYPSCGKIVLSQGKKVYSVLYKDHSISDINRVMPIDSVGSAEIDD